METKNVLFAAFFLAALAPAALALDINAANDANSQSQGALSDQNILAADMNVPAKAESPKAFEPSAKAKEVLAALSEARSKVRAMNDKNFQTVRIADEIFLVQQIYENALNREKEGGIPDYSAAETKLEAISALIGLAYLNSDELTALGDTIEQQKQQMDVAPVEEIFAQAKKEFADQRYEQSRQLIDSAYTKISELQSLQAKTSAAYEAAKKTLEGFLSDNWPYLLVAIGAPALAYAMLRKRIKRFFINREISSNESEIIVLKNEIKKAQQIYFVEGRIPESEYGIKTKIYSEKIRDLNRANALLREELAGLKYTKRFSYKGKEIDKLKY